MTQFGRLAVAALVALLAACTSGPRVRADYDRGVDFSRYGSFAFTPVLGTDEERYSSLTTQRLKAATRRELEARGYRYDEADPDLLVNFGAKLQEKTRVYPTPTPIGYYGYRSFYYSAWPGWSYGGQVDQYTEGTLNVDLVDAREKRLVWEGVAIGRVSAKMRDDPEGALNQAVAEIFATYGFRAGQGGG